MRGPSRRRFRKLLPRLRALTGHQAAAGEVAEIAIAIVAADAAEMDAVADRAPAAATALLGAKPPTTSRPAISNGSPARIPSKGPNRSRPASCALGTRAC